MLNYLQNGGNAAKAARDAGYSKKNCDNAGARMLVNAKVCGVLSALRAQFESDKIASIDEVLQFFTRVLRKPLKEFTEAGLDGDAGIIITDETPDTDLLDEISSVASEDGKNIRTKVRVVAKSVAGDIILKTKGAYKDSPTVNIYNGVDPSTMSYEQLKEAAEAIKNRKKR